MNKQRELCHAQVEDKHVNKVVWESLKCTQVLNENKKDSSILIFSN
jgi:hypothetical protein